MSAVTISYNKEGKTFHPKDETEVYAQSVSNDRGTTTHYVKKGRSGMNSSFFLNPYNMWHVEGSESGFDKRTGRNTYELSKVTPECFQFYIRFLQTKNESYLRNAEREMQ